MKKITIVDDDMEYLDELSEMLGSAGYIIVPMFEETAAIAVARSLRPDVILLDLKLKRQSGFTIAIELQKYEETRDIPIIAMTGYYAEKECLDLQKACNIKMILYKPFTMTDVTSAIEKVVL